QTLSWLSLSLCCANGFANTGAYGLGEDVPDACRVLAQNVRVDPQGHRRGRRDRAGPRLHAPGLPPGAVSSRGGGEGRDAWRGGAPWAEVRPVVAIEQFGHQGGHGVGVERLSPSGGEDQAAGIGPG